MCIECIAFSITLLSKCQQTGSLCPALYVLAFDYSPHPCSGGVTGGGGGVDDIKGEGGGDEECKCS